MVYVICLIRVSRFESPNIDSEPIHSSLLHTALPELRHQWRKDQLFHHFIMLVSSAKLCRRRDHANACFLCTTIIPGYLAEQGKDQTCRVKGQQRHSKVFSTKLLPVGEKKAQNLALWKGGGIILATRCCFPIGCAKFSLPTSFVGINVPIIPPPPP